MPAEPTVTISTRLTIPARAELRERAKARHLSVAAYIARLIDRDLEEP